MNKREFQVSICRGRENVMRICLQKTGYLESTSDFLTPALIWDLQMINKYDWMLSFKFQSKNDQPMRLAQAQRTKLVTPRKRKRNI